MALNLWRKQVHGDGWMDEGAWMVFRKACGNNGQGKVDQMCEFFPTIVLDRILSYCDEILIPIHKLRG